MMSQIQFLKISLMTNGIEISETARNALSRENNCRIVALSDYATTSGITLKLQTDVWVNAPIESHNSNFVSRSSNCLVHEDGRFWVLAGDLKVSAEPVPLPSYQDEQDPEGIPYTENAITHADRVRISPIEGCSFACKFCDSSFKRSYRRKPLDSMLRAIQKAIDDPRLPAKHILISGGTPESRDYQYLNEVYSRVAQSFPSVDVDVMMVPLPGLLEFKGLYEAGIHGLSINIELFNPELARQITPQKASLGRQQWLSSIAEAVNVFGLGRVRSLLVVGLEPIEDTLRGVRELARVGCEPVLSPFRPDPATPLRNLSPPGEAYLREVFDRSVEIVEQFGVKLGPRCIPCQHNTLTFPDGSDYYYYN